MITKLLWASMFFVLCLSLFLVVTAVNDAAELQVIVEGSVNSVALDEELIFLEIEKQRNIFKRLKDKDEVKQEKQKYDEWFSDVDALKQKIKGHRCVDADEWMCNVAIENELSHLVYENHQLEQLGDILEKIDKIKKEKDKK